VTATSRLAGAHIVGRFPLEGPEDEETSPEADSPGWLIVRPARLGRQVQPARCPGEPAIAGSMFHRAGRPGGVRDRTVIPDGLVRNRRRAKVTRGRQR
jgi:hypothetical protein